MVNRGAGIIFNTREIVGTAETAETTETTETTERVQR